MTTTQQLAAQLGKNTGETLIVKNVFGDYYRCNWIKTEGFGTYSISRSAFLKVTSLEGKLQIEERNATVQKRRGILEGCLS